MINTGCQDYIFPMSCPRADQGSWLKVFLVIFCPRCDQSQSSLTLPQPMAHEKDFIRHCLWPAMTVGTTSWRCQCSSQESSLEWGCCQGGLKEMASFFEAPANFPFLRIVPGRTWKKTGDEKNLQGLTWWKLRRGTPSSQRSQLWQGCRKWSRQAKFRKHKVFYV